MVNSWDSLLEEARDAGTEQSEHVRRLINELADALELETKAAAWRVRHHKDVGYEYKSPGYCFDNAYNDRRCSFIGKTRDAVRAHVAEFHLDKDVKLLQREIAGPWEDCDE